MADFDKELRELIWYELGDGLNATDVDEAVESIKRLVGKSHIPCKEIEEAIGEDKTAYGDNLPCIYDARQMIESNNALRAELRSKLLGEKNG